MFEAPPNVNGFSAAAGAAAPPKEKLGADVVAVEGFELPPNEKLGAADSCFVGSANLGVALKENEGAACVVVELEVPPKENFNCSLYSFFHVIGHVRRVVGDHGHQLFFNVLPFDIGIVCNLGSDVL